MGEVIVLLVISAILVIGAMAGSGMREHQAKNVLGVTLESIESMKADCEAALPRDKFCKLEIKAVEEN